MSMISVAGVTKRYASGLVALDSIDLEIRKGEIFALLGPNGAGKTTLIGVICGLVSMTAGKVSVDGFDVVKNYRQARERIGLVPQEIALDIFSTVWNTARFSRGLFGKPPDPDYLERLLKDLSLLEKRNSRVIELSGGMKRRVMIAKALSHQPDVLFLDEPTAGVDVNLRRDMWALVRRLRESGVTIVLTTHYIEEAEEMADRVGVIDHGKLVLVDDKAALMRRLGTRRLTVRLAQTLNALPPELADPHVVLCEGGRTINVSFDGSADGAIIPAFLARLDALHIPYVDLETAHSTLEDIFVSIVGRPVP